MSQTDEQKNCLFPLKNRVTAFMVVYVTKDINMKLPNPHLHHCTNQNQHKGMQIKINRQNWQYIISFTFTNTTWLNQLSRREVSVDDAVGWTGLDYGRGPGKGCTIFTGAPKHLRMKIIYAYSPCKQ